MSANLNTLPGRAQRRRRGLTLIEAAMVLVILALVVGAVMLYYQSANQNRQISAVAGQLAATQQAVRSAYAGVNDLTGITEKEIQKYLPASMTDSQGNIRHAFNGPMKVSTTNGSYFTVSLNGIPYDACKRLATMDMGRATLGLNIVKGAGGGSEDITNAPPFTKDNAQTACGDTGVTSLAWTFQ